MEGYELFMKRIYTMTQIDLSSYKERQMRRRIESLIMRNNYCSYEAFFETLKRDNKLFSQFISYLTINVSEFYRNPQQWEILEKEVLPMLLKDKRKLKIWSAACSTGEEPYSLVMLLSKFIPLEEINILATDIDLGSINSAKTGIYCYNSLAGLPIEFIRRFFDKLNGSYFIKEIVKNQVTFKHHNLLEDKYPDDCDLIICRNVMIYLTEESKNKMYFKFRDALDKNGVLFVGTTEQIILPGRYQLTPLKAFFYKRISS